MSKQEKIQSKLFLTLISLMILASCNRPTSSIDSDLQTMIDSVLQLKMSEINAISRQAIVIDIAGSVF